MLMMVAKGWEGRIKGATGVGGHDASALTRFQAHESSIEDAQKMM